LGLRGAQTEEALDPLVGAVELRSGRPHGRGDLPAARGGAAVLSVARQGQAGRQGGQGGPRD